MSVILTPAHFSPPGNPPPSKSLVSLVRKQMSSRDDSEEKGLLWKLPVVKSRDFGKVGPAFGIGVGCGIGFGLGLLGGVGLGPGIPGLQVGFGFGAGCGIGLGFGYGVGKGIAQDENRRYSNVGNVLHGAGNFLSQDEINALVDDVVISTKKLIRVTSREINKRR